MKEDDCMYFVTGLLVHDNDEDEHKIQTIRCFGYYKDFLEAEEEVKNNSYDMYEYLYNYVVIEKLDEGIFQVSTERKTYKFNLETRKYENCESLKALENAITISI